jgi:hypothetical protein
MITKTAIGNYLRVEPKRLNWTPVVKCYEAGVPTWDALRDAILEMINTAQQPAEAPDCRTCFKINVVDTVPLCSICTNGDQYQHVPKVVLWRTE